MALAVNPDMKMGFWVGLGVVVAMIAVSFVQALLGRVAK